MSGITLHDARRAALVVALVTLALLLVLLAAMHYADAVHWSPADFVAAGVLLFSAGFTFALVLKSTPRIALRLAYALALGGALLLVWTNLAVGVLGRPGNPANLMYAGVLVIGLAGGVLARLKPRGMALAMLATALALVLAAAIALLAGLADAASHPGVILVSHGLFVALFLASSWLFRHAARRPDDHDRH